MTTLEIRSCLNVDELEFRSEETDEGITFTGYAARFMSLSEDLGGFREVIIPGAFKRSLAEDKNIDVVMLSDHEWSIFNILGRRSEGTLTLVEDAYGLRFKAVAPKTTKARDAAELVRGKYVKGLSFGFNIKDSSIRKTESDGKEEYVQELRDIELHEISLVTNPAYPSTKVNVRDAVLNQIRQMETPWRLQLLERQMKLLER